MLKKNLQVLAAVLAFAGAAHAEDGSGDGGQNEFVNYTGYEAVEQSSPLNCAEARNTAWFERELARTDGDVEPVMKAVECRPEHLAEVSTADAD